MSTFKQKNLDREVELRILSHDKGFARTSDNLGVYVIKSGDYYKIGYTNNLIRRIDGIKTGNPLGGEIKVIFWILTSEAKKLESFLHDKYQYKRHFREWFKLEEDDLKGLIEVMSKWWINLGI